MSKPVASRNNNRRGARCFNRWNRLSQHFATAQMLRINRDVSQPVGGHAHRFGHCRVPRERARLGLGCTRPAQSVKRQCLNGCQGQVFGLTHGLFLGKLFIIWGLRQWSWPINPRPRPRVHATPQSREHKLRRQNLPADLADRGAQRRGLTAR